MNFHSNPKHASRRRLTNFFLLITLVGVIVIIASLSHSLAQTSQSQPTSVSGLNQASLPNTGSNPSFSPLPGASTLENRSGFTLNRTAPVQKPASTGQDIFLPLITHMPLANRVPYTSDSTWNIPIGPKPEYDPHSDQMIATIGLKGDGQIYSDPDQYSYPVYTAYDNTPRWDVPCTKYACTVVTPQKSFTTEILSNVPIPEQARPSAGSDAQMIIIDWTNYTEYDLWQVQRTPDGWSVSNGSVYNIMWDGTPQRYGSRGAGIPYLAGLIRPWEITQGQIQHAIAFGYPEPAGGRCVYPATKTDGTSSLPFAIPQGARLQLDPSLTEADFNRLGLSRTGKIIAKALQEYGMILVDTSGQAKIYVEDVQANPYLEIDWSDPGLNLTSTTIANIPYSSFHVLKLPNAYWNPGIEKANYGNCYIDPLP